jgi:hypothetical protein
MQNLLDQIEGAQAHGLYTLALSASLTIPDICGALEAHNGWATRDRYLAWYEKNVVPMMPGAPPALDVYRFRCSLLHQGRALLSGASSTRVIFIEPGKTSNVFHNCRIGDALLIDEPLFVAALVSAARKWLAGPGLSPNVAANLGKFVARHPDGLAPYVGGVSVIG